MVQKLNSLRKEVENPDEDAGERETAKSDLNQLVGLESAIRKNNWDLLLSHYGDDLRSYDVIFSYVVLDADQEFRLMLAGGFGVICLLLGLLLPLNGISIHSYYREQLASVWVNPVGKSGRQARLDDVDTVSRGFPYHIINATLYQFGSPRDPDLFVFSPKFCGSHRTGFVETDHFEGGINLTDAMAVSGAAVSPMVSPNPLVRVLLLLANFRLGEWVPNPAREFASRFPPAPLPLLRDMLLRDPSYYNYCFVTDGGLADNTGIASLMHRRCRVIIVVDASQDEDCHFHDLLEVVENQRTEFGRVFSAVPFETSGGTETAAGRNPFERHRIPLELLQNDKEGLARSHYVVAAMHYPKDRYSDEAGLADSQTGYLIYVKPSFDGDEPADVVQYRSDNPVFPHDPTYDQFFDSHKFESYRRLGEHIGNEVWEHLLKPHAEKTINAEALIPPWLAYWQPFPSGKEVPTDEEAGGAEPEPKPVGPAPNPEQDQNASLDRLQEFLSQSVPFKKKLDVLKKALNHDDSNIRIDVCPIIGDYLQKLWESAMGHRHTREMRRNLCVMLIERFDREEDFAVKGSICKILHHDGTQLKEVQEFFDRDDVKEDDFAAESETAGPHQNGKKHEHNGRNQEDTEGTTGSVEEPPMDRDV